MAKVNYLESAHGRKKEVVSERPLFASRRLFDFVTAGRPEGRSASMTVAARNPLIPTLPAAISAAYSAAEFQMDVQKVDGSIEVV